MFSKKLEKKSTDELLAIIRHESHRIEKSFYNCESTTNNRRLEEKIKDLKIIYRLLKKRNSNEKDPTLIWSKEIFQSFPFVNEFIKRNSSVVKSIGLCNKKKMLEFMKNRRSVRSWDENKTDEATLRKMALEMIEAGKWAPNSGNRQPWKFSIITNKKEKEMLRGIKEYHCIKAPCLIFIGMDSRFYGAYNKQENSLYIDAGAAIMSMIFFAHNCGLGTSWNHLSDDVIKKNKKIYNYFCDKLNVPKYITPVALLAFGYPAYIPPTPNRIETNRLII